MGRDQLTRTPIDVEAAENMETLRKNPYPGRGIVMGMSENGNHAIQIYWVMGRSENSRNRILVEENGVVRTEPFDASKVQDPNLIIYTAIREVQGIHLVSNGDQTDSVADVISYGGDFEHALTGRTYEPDAPNFTPRISAMYFNSAKPFKFSSIRKNPDGSTEPIRDLHRPEPTNGIGYVIHTYKGDGDPLPSFDQAPYPVPLTGSLEEIAATFWDALNAANRVALAAKSIDTRTGTVDFRIINQLVTQTE